MDNSTKSMLWLAVQLFLFGTACLAALYLSGGMQKVTQLSEPVMQGQKQSVQQYIGISEPLTYTGAQVRQSIAQIQEIGVDMQIDHSLYPHHIQPEPSALLKIDVQRTYQVTYQMDQQGNIVTIQFS